MAVRPKRYESKGGRKIRAVKVTERNYDDLAGWIGRNATNLKANPVAVVKLSATGDETDHRVKLHLSGLGIRVARVGDYVAHVLEDDLTLTNGNLFIIKGDIFEGKYTEIKK
jgi:hypothetical protein